MDRVSAIAFSEMAMHPLIRLAAIVVLLGAGFQEAVPESALKPLREATVFIRTGAGPDQSSGSGFLIRSEGDVGHVVTNAHVVSRGRIVVTFFPGTDSETSVPATIVAWDDHWDLAVLRVESKNLPKPLDLASRPKLRETSPVIILGFPFGRFLQTGRKSPAPTITNGVISSLHNDSAGEAEIIQIDGSVDPGNSGGPVVDRSGALVGVTVAKILGTKIAFAIPSSRVERVMKGRIRYVTLEVAENKNRRIRLKISGALTDPLESLTAMTLLMAPSSGAPPRGEKRPPGPAAPDMREIPLTRSTGGLVADAELTSDTGKDVIYVYQARFTRKDGQVGYTEPLEFRAEFSKGEAPARREDDWIEGGPPGAPAKKPDPAPASDQPPAARVIDQPAAPRPESIGSSIVKSEQALENWSLKATRIPTSWVTQGEVWSEKGEWVCVLGAKGVIHKITTADLKEERRLDTGRVAVSLMKGRDGLVLVIPSQEGLEAWLVDSGTLEVRLRLLVPDVSRIVANPAIPFVYAVERSGTYLQGIELPTGRRAFRQSANRGQDQDPKAKWHPSARRPGIWRTVSVTPDGKTLLALNRSFFRYSLSPESAVLEEAGPAVFPESSELVLSPDSRYVAASNFKKPAEGFAEDGLSIVRVGDLAKPVATLPSTTRFFAFDRAAGRVYLAEQPGVLAAFNPNGEVLARFSLKSPHQTIGALFLHPEGRKGLLMTPDGYAWFEMIR